MSNPENPADLTFARDAMNAAQGVQLSAGPDLSYLDVAVSIRGTWQCSMSGYVTKEVAALVLAAPDLLTSARALLAAFGGNTPDWLRGEARALEAAVIAAEGRS
jgi:hypothetical protein